MNRGAQRGFSLLEVLVAFAILGVSLGVLLEIFATGTRNSAVMEEYTKAGLYAESILAAVGRETPLTEGSAQGGIDGFFSWRTEVTPFTDAEMNPDTLNVTPYRVVVEVFWQTPQHTTRSVVLETLQLTTPLVR